MRKTLTTLAAAGLVLALPGVAAAEDGRYTANLAGMNDSGGNATATIDLDGTTAAITISGSGFFDGFPHAMHIHGEPGGTNVCPPLNPGDAEFDDVASQNLEDGTPVLSVADGAPFYGGVAVSLTTEGDTTPDSALAVDRFPTSGTIDYTRTIELPEDVAADLTSLHLVIHGTDLNGDGEIGPVLDEDGEEIPSSLDPELPIEATAPAACGQVSFAGGADGEPVRVDTGAGGTAMDTTVRDTTLAGTLALAALAAFGLRRRAILN